MVKPVKNGRIAGVFLFDLAPVIVLVVFFVAAIQLSLAQTAPEGDDRKNPPIAVGQTNLNLEIPTYTSTREMANDFHASEAVGITPKKAHCKDVKVDLYEVVKGTNSVTTVVTSKEADIWVGDRIMRTTNNVRIERQELVATAETADFNLETKKYVLRHNVQILLIHFDIGKAATTANTNNAPVTPPPTPAPIPADLQKMISHDPGSVGLPQ